MFKYRVSGYGPPSLGIVVFIGMYIYIYILKKQSSGFRECDEAWLTCGQ